MTDYTPTRYKNQLNGKTANQNYRAYWRMRERWWFDKKDMEEKLEQALNEVIDYLNSKK